MFSNFEGEKGSQKVEDKLTLIHIFIFEGFSHSNVDNDMNLMHVLRQIKEELVELEKKD